MSSAAAGDFMLKVKTRTVRNPHGSARAALDKWLARNLWGSPIPLGPSKFHVYGCNSRRWTQVMVEFTDDRITVAKMTRGAGIIGSAPGKSAPLRPSAGTTPAAS